MHPSDGNGNLATNPIASNFSRGLLEIPHIRNLQMISHENCHVNRRFSSHVWEHRRVRPLDFPAHGVTNMPSLNSIHLCQGYVLNSSKISMESHENPWNAMGNDELNVDLQPPGPLPAPQRDPRPHLGSSIVDRSPPTNRPLECWGSGWGCHLPTQSRHPTPACPWRICIPWTMAWQMLQMGLVEHVELDQSNLFHELEGK